jgi:hypothetical protein
MASPAAPVESPSSGSSDETAQVNRLVRHSLDISITESEYEVLHRRLIARLPSSVQNRAYSPAKFDAIVRSGDRYNAAAIRTSLRVFLGTAAAMKLVDEITARLAARKFPYGYISR